MRISSGTGVTAARMFPAALLAVALVVANLLAAHAHGGGVPVVTRGEVGGHLLYVWLNPGAPQAGEALHVTVGVTLPDAGGIETPVTDALVAVRARPSSGAVIEAPALPGADAGGLYYEADLTLESGDYSIEVQVTPATPAVAGALDGGVVSFPITVEAASGVRWWLVGLGSIAIVAGVVLYLIAIARGRRDAKTVTA